MPIPRGHVDCQRKNQRGSNIREGESAAGRSGEGSLIANCKRIKLRRGVTTVMQAVVAPC